MKTPKKPEPRAIRLLAQPSPDTDGWGMLQITAHGETARYLVRFVPQPFHGRTVLEVVKQPDDPNERFVPTADVPEPRYTVIFTGDGRRDCDCPAGTYRKTCKHADGLAALLNAGALQAPA